MKTKLYLWPLLALVALSCGKEMAVETPEAPAIQPEERDLWTFYPDEENVLDGELQTLEAGFETTKSQLHDNGSGNFSVIWTENDQFSLYGFGTSQIFRADYTATSISDEKTIFASTGGMGESTEFHAIYPSSSAVSTGTVTINEEKQRAFWITIPSAQVAASGSVAEEANVSYAHPTNLNERLVFKNVVSLLKFRLSGSIVSQVKSITLRSTNYMAGGYALIAPDGDPQLLPEIVREGYPKMNSIVLSGTFQTDTDYFIALAPGVHTGISMVFANDENQILTKLSAKTFRFDRSKITDFGTIKLGDSFNETVSTDPVQYITATAAAPKTVTLAVIPEGYTLTELPEYEIRAKAGIDALFNVEPFKSYKAYFNVWILKVASNESGAKVTDGNGGILVDKDCYFETKWGANSYGDMRSNDDKVFNFVSENCPDIKNDPDKTIYKVPVLIIINDARYGGRAISFSDGKTYCMAPTTAGNLAWGYPARKARTDEVIDNPTLEYDLIDTPAEELAEVGSNTGNWMNTLVHEFGGHSFGRLRDEYWYDNSMKTLIEVVPDGDPTIWPVPFGGNIAYKPSEVPWQAFMTQIEGSQVYQNKYRRMGVFQGADVSPFNRWRSERVSCMIDNRFYFSAFQRYLIVQRIRTLAGLSELSLTDFLANDVTTDPLRDEVSSNVIGVSNAVPPRPVPMLPPPVLVEE